EQPKRSIACACGKVRLELSGAPFLVNVCHCDDCQRGSAQIEALSGAPRILDGFGGTAYALYRKDRVRIIQGRELIVDQRIEGEKDTRRALASCCNSPLFLDFEPGHWLSLYQARFDAPVPPAERRVQTRFMPPGRKPDDGLPLHRGFPLVMVWKLLATRIAMGRAKAPS
ncbi:MAG TPA: hypothetical protein VFL04_03785, partial [Rectinemataceae bacterium]|nr:hypothetical protein [Rectinemataceae bacterium]